MASLRQHLGIGGLWAALAWLTAVLLSQQIAPRSIWESLSWSYALRAVPLGFLVGMLGTLGFCLDPILWLNLRFPRRIQLATFVVGAAQGGLLGLCLGLLGTFLILFIWPNEAQNNRLDAWKWVVFYWTSHFSIFLPISILGGMGATWLGFSLRRSSCV